MASLKGKNTILGDRPRLKDTERLTVDRPCLVIYSKTANMNTAESNVPQAQDCGICHEKAEDPVVTACEHCFCKACLMEYSAVLGQVACPACSKPLNYCKEESRRWCFDR